MRASHRLTPLSPVARKRGETSAETYDLWLVSAPRKPVFTDP